MLHCYVAVEFKTMIDFEKIKKIVEKKMEGISPSHDFSHVMRVYNLCLELAKGEKNVDLEVLKLAALLHDVERKKRRFR